MRRYQFLRALTLLGFLCACTPYESKGLLGGYQDAYIGNDQYHITVGGNGYTSIGTVEEYFYRRAQEIVQQHGAATYQVVEFHSGMQRSVLGVRPFATGVIQLYRNEQEDSGGTATRQSGSAFFVDAAADALTNYHVVKGCSDISILGPVPETKVRVAASDPTADLALLQPVTSLSVSVLEFRDGPGPRTGDSIVAIGYPLHGLLASEANVTTGTVSALAGMNNDDRYVQITAPVQPGNSGGPLLDMSGDVVGVVSSGLDSLKVASVTGAVPQNVNFAVKYLIVRNFLDTHAVNYATSPLKAQLSAADVAERAKKATVFVACR